MTRHEVAQALIDAVCSFEQGGLEATMNDIERLHCKLVELCLSLHQRARQDLRRYIDGAAVDAIAKQRLK